MYNINETYKKYISTSVVRKPKSKIIVDGTEYTGVTHLKTFPKIEHTTVDMFGSFPTKTCEFEIYNIDGSVELRGKEVSVYRALDIEGIVHWIPMGIFKAESKDITSNLTTKTIKFKGSDRSHLFDVAFNSDLHTYPCNLLAFVKQLCTNHSIVLENEDFPFCDLELEKAPEFTEGITEREIIRKIAQLGGCIAQITRDGKLKISQPEVADIPITSGKYSSLSRENTIYVTGLTLSQSENEDVTVTDSTYVGAYGEFVYRINDNPFIKDRRSEVIDSIANCYLGRNITPFVLNGFIDDFIYDLNDVVTVKDKSGTEFTTPLLSITTQSRIKSDFKTEVQKENNSSDGDLEGSVKQAIKEANKNVSAYKNAQSALNELMSNAMGLYISEVNDGAGGKIYYYHDTADIANATYIATINSNGFAFTSGSGCWNGGNPNFTNGVTKEGNAILQVIYANKISASLIKAGRLESNGGNAYFDLDNEEIWLMLKDSQGETTHSTKLSPFGQNMTCKFVSSPENATLTEDEKNIIKNMLIKNGFKEGSLSYLWAYATFEGAFLLAKTKYGVNIEGTDENGDVYKSSHLPHRFTVSRENHDEDGNITGTKTTERNVDGVFSDGSQKYQAEEHIFSDGFDEFKPYFTAGDSLDVDINTTGVLTDDKKSVRFCIPLSKPVLGNLEIEFITEETDGFILLQNGNYTHGSDGSSDIYVNPGEYKANVMDGIGVNVYANGFSDLTNAINNSPIGIIWKGKIVFLSPEAVLDNARLDYMTLG